MPKSPEEDSCLENLIKAFEKTIEETRMNVEEEANLEAEEQAKLKADEEKKMD